MKRIMICLLVLLCLSVLSVNAWATEESSGWYIDDQTKTLYISGKGSTADIKADGWKGKLEVEHIVIGEGINQISDNAFEGCIYLKTVQLPSTLTQIGRKAFKDSGLTAIEIPKGVTTIGEYAFYLCTRLETVTLPQGLKIIGGNAFHKCKSLKKLDIPGSMEAFGTKAFAECTALEEVRVHNGVTSLNDLEFYQCTSLRYLELPDTLESLRTYDFSYLSALETVRIGSGLTKLSDSAFFACDNLKRYEISPDNKTFCSVDGVIYSKDKTKLIRLPLGYEGAYEVPEGTLEIGKNAANDCTKLTSVTVSDSVTLINDYAFCDCTSLETVILGQGVKEIEQGAFYHDKKLKNLTLNEGLEVISGNAFSDCVGLKELTLPSTIRLLKNNVFGGCKGLKRVEFLGDKPTIWSQVFQGVGAEAYHPEGNTTWDDGRLDYDGHLIWPQEPSYQKYSGTCGGLLKWELNPDTGVLTISGKGQMGTFSNNYDAIKDQIKEVVIQEGVLTMGQMFDLVHVKKITLPASVRQIVDKAFYRWTALEHVEILGDGVALGTDIFFECPAIQTVRFTGNMPVAESSMVFYGFVGTLYYPANNPTWDVDNWIINGAKVIYDEITCVAEGEAEPDPQPPVTEPQEQEKEEQEEQNEEKKPSVLIWLLPVLALVIAGASVTAALLWKKK